MSQETIRAIQIISSEYILAGAIVLLILSIKAPQETSRFISILSSTALVFAAVVILIITVYKL